MENKIDLTKLERICFNCNTKMEEKSRELEISRNGYTLKLNGLKAYVCPKCGQIIYNSSDIKIMENLCLSLSESNINETNIYLNVSELAETLRVSNQTIYNMIKDGRLKPVKFGKEWRFMKKDLESIVNNNETLLAARGLTSISKEDKKIIDKYFEED